MKRRNKLIILFVFVSGMYPQYKQVLQTWNVIIHYWFYFNWRNSRIKLRIRRIRFYSLEKKNDSFKISSLTMTSAFKIISHIKAAYKNVNGCLYINRCLKTPFINENCELVVFYVRLNIIETSATSATKDGYFLSSWRRQFIVLSPVNFLYKEYLVKDVLAIILRSVSLYHYTLYNSL